MNILRPNLEHVSSSTLIKKDEVIAAHVEKKDILNLNTKGQPIVNGQWCNIVFFKI